MKFTRMLTGTLVLCAMYSQAAMAQPMVTVESVEIPAGTTSVNVEVVYDGNPEGTGGQFQVVYDATELTADIAATCPTPAVWGCSQVNPGTIQFASGAFLAGGLPDFAGDVVFDLTSAVLDKPYALTVENEIYTETGGTVSPPHGSVDGEILVVGPVYFSDPVAGSPLNLGSVQQGDPDLQSVVDVSNAGGGTLSVNCSDTIDPGNVFSVSPVGDFTVDADDPAQAVTVTCDSDGAIATHTGTLSCAHDGSSGPGSPVEYSLSCIITAGPQPAYTSDPVAGTPINLVATNQGDPVAPAMVTISNSGDAGTTLTGTCAFLGMAPPQLSVVDGAFSVAEGGDPDVQTISCDSSAEGIYSATLSCSHNGSNASPANYAVSCDVGPQRDAVFASTPVPGTTTDMTASFPGGEAVVGDTVPDSILTIRNDAVAGSRDLQLQCGETMPGVLGISASPNGGNLDTSIVPGGSTQVTFSCDTAQAGSFTYAYQCSYVEDGGEAPTGDAFYTYTCDVRDPESDVVPTPASGSTLSGIVSPGGSATLQAVFGETNDEGADGTLESCTLADGTNFAITSPTFPGSYPIPSGGTLPVVVEGTDPGGVESITDTLTCTYFDSGSGEGGVTVNYNLLLTVGGNSGFTVTKTFTDGRTDEVDVTLTCNGGLPLEQSFTIAGGGPGVTFVVSNVETGPTCEVTESGGPDGYTAVMNGGAGCVFEDVQPGGEYTCAIENIANPGMFTVHKEWLITEPADEDDIRQIAELWVFCDKPIIGSESGSEGDVPLAPPIYGHGYPVLGDGYVTAYVDTSTGPANCTGAEGVFGYENPPSGVEATSDCPPAINDVNQGVPDFTDPSTWIEVEAGGSGECTITNTLFFEGIPTLSQWGMAIMALLMLGMGMIGFRRFA